MLLRGGRFHCPIVEALFKVSVLNVVQDIRVVSETLGTALDAIVPQQLGAPAEVFLLAQRGLIEVHAGDALMQRLAPARENGVP